MANEVTVITPEQRALATVEVTSRMVACNGGGGVLGHPLTYYEVGADGTATCNYCDTTFVLAGSTGEAQG